MDNAQESTLTERQRYWLNHIRACEASGKSIADYAVDHAVFTILSIYAFLIYLAFLQDMTIAAGIMEFIVKLYVGVEGNKWRRKYLLKRDYVLSESDDTNSVIKLHRKISKKQLIFALVIDPPRAA